MRIPTALVMSLTLCLVLAACEGDNNPANPTPASLTVTLEVFGAHGITLSNVVSGDAGCPNQELARAAVSFSASGLDQATATRIYLYGFRNRAAFQRLASTIDACARSYVTDAAAYGSVMASPLVLSGAGPWAPAFAARLREALVAAAGNGG